MTIINKYFVKVNVRKVHKYENLCVYSHIGVKKL